MLYHVLTVSAITLRYTVLLLTCACSINAKHSQYSELGLRGIDLQANHTMHNPYVHHMAKNWWVLQVLRT